MTSPASQDDELARLVHRAPPSRTVSCPPVWNSYAPAEFYTEDGKTPVGYDVDMTKAIARCWAQEPKIVSSMFDTIIPSIGTKYDLGLPP